MQEADHNKTQNRPSPLLDPVFYGDIFDYPLTSEEIRRFCTIPYSLRELETQLQHPEEAGRFLAHREGFFYLKGREEIVEIRKARARDSEKVWLTARRVVNGLKYIPFLRGMMVTGSLAVDNAHRKDDIDFLVLAAPRRIWFLFFFLGVLQRIFTHRFLCPNYYLSVDHMEISRHCFYVAREAVQARPVFGRTACSRFYEDNAWIHDFFPNAKDYLHSRVHSPEKDDHPSTNHFMEERRGLFRILSGALEWMFKGRLGDAAEALLKKVLKQRLYAHYGKHGQPVPEPVLQNALNERELRFHGLDHEKSILELVEERKKQYMALMKDRGKAIDPPGGREEAAGGA